MTAKLISNGKVLHGQEVYSPEYYIEAHNGKDPLKERTRINQRHLLENGPQIIRTAYASNLFPGLKEITIPREILSSPAITPRQKLMYGLINHFYPFPCMMPSLYLSGLLNISVDAVTRDLMALRKAGLIRTKMHYYTKPGAKYVGGISRHYIVKQPKDKIKPRPPVWLASDISNFDEYIKNAFPKIDFSKEELDAAIAKAKTPAQR